MRTFMPGPHANLITDIESIVNTRQYVVQHNANAELIAAYNAAVASVSDFRDQHIRIATRYVILPSRMASQAAEKAAQGSIGTGGTMLVPFLRQARDETLAATVKEARVMES